MPPPAFSEAYQLHYLLALLSLTAGYNEALGARELRRAVTRLVDDALSDALLRGEVRGHLDWQGCKALLVRLFIFWPCRPGETLAPPSTRLTACLPSHSPRPAGAHRRGCCAGLRRRGPHPGVQPLPRQQHCGGRHCLLLGGGLSLAGVPPAIKPCLLLLGLHPWMPRCKQTPANPRQPHAPACPSAHVAGAAVRCDANAARHTRLPCSSKRMRRALPRAPALSIVSLPLCPPAPSPCAMPAGTGKAPWPTCLFRLAAAVLTRRLILT